MKITVLAALCLFLQVTASAAPEAAKPAAGAAKTPTEVAAPPVPENPNTGIKVAPEKVCYVLISKEAVEADKLCVPLDLVQCSKSFRTCKMTNYDRKCHGVKYNYCLSSTPKECSDGLSLVAEFPSKLAATNRKYKCSETSPIKITRLKK